MKRKISIILATAIAAVAFTGCSGGKDKWGIDHDAATATVSHGPRLANGDYRCNIEDGDAMLVKAGQRVKPLTKDTRLRVWHYQNSDEYVCLLRGKAVILSN